MENINIIQTQVWSLGFPRFRVRYEMRASGGGFLFSGPIYSKDPKDYFSVPD